MRAPLLDDRALFSFARPLYPQARSVAAEAAIWTATNLIKQYSRQTYASNLHRRQTYASSPQVEERCVVVGLLGFWGVSGKLMLPVRGKLIGKVTKLYFEP